MISKKNIDTNTIINELRLKRDDIAWVGIDIEGTNAYVNVVEKTKLPESAKNENTIGDIISDKSGIIEKIVAENGTPILSAGEYVEEGRILIEGKIYSDTLETKDVTAKGIVTLNTEYEYKADYNDMDDLFIPAIFQGYELLSKTYKSYFTDEFSIVKKLIDKKSDKFYCLGCLAEMLEVTEDELLEKIEEFKDEGCTLFK